MQRCCFEPRAKMRGHFISWPVPIGAEHQGRSTDQPILIPQRASETFLRSTADALPADDILFAVPQAFPDGVLQHRCQHRSRIGGIPHEIPMALATYAPTRGYFLHLKHFSSHRRMREEGNTVYQSW